MTIRMIPTWADWAALWSQHRVAFHNADGSSDWMRGCPRCAGSGVVGKDYDHPAAGWTLSKTAGWWRRRRRCVLCPNCSDPLTACAPRREIIGPAEGLPRDHAPGPCFKCSGVVPEMEALVVSEGPGSGLRLGR